MLRLGMNREWVDECRLSNERTRSEVAEALRFIVRGHTRRNRSPSSSHENLNTIEILPGGNIVQQVVVEQFEAIQHTREKSHEGLDHAEV
ncbi:hypothetical protein B296_00005066 [Ensete ventricosum]|uniref:Uncharacterized protein n=1 Tax=Ensete ventricosum TaxID=4639 RepID=A0A427ADQ4_ENSVE|nr:hypothetical protein B296_00005066 [Ensete ventricosum]